MGKKFSILTCECPVSEGIHTDNWAGKKATVCEGKMTDCYLEKFGGVGGKKVVKLNTKVARIFVD